MTVPEEYRVVFRWDESVKHLIHMHRTNRAYCNDRVRGKRGQKWGEWTEAGESERAVAHVASLEWCPLCAGLLL